MDDFLFETIPVSNFLECVNGIYENDSFPKNSTIVMPNETNIDYIHDVLYNKSDIKSAKKLLDRCIFKGYYPLLEKASDNIYRYDSSGIKITNGKISNKQLIKSGFSDDLRVAIYECDVMFNKPPPIRASKHPQNEVKQIRKVLMNNIISWNSTAVSHITSLFLIYLQRTHPRYFKAALCLLDYNPLVSFMILFQPNNTTSLFPESVYSDWYSEMEEVNIEYNKKQPIKIGGVKVNTDLYVKLMKIPVLDDFDKFLNSNLKMRESCIQRLNTSILLNSLSDAINTFALMKGYHYSLMPEEYSSLLDGFADKIIYFDELRYFAFIKNIKTLDRISSCDFSDYIYFDTKTNIHSSTIAKFINSSCCMYVKPISVNDYGDLHVDVESLQYDTEQIGNITKCVAQRYSTAKSGDDLVEKLQNAINSGEYSREQLEALLKK